MDKVRKIYVDQPSWHEPIVADDFLITIGKKQSNSVYHVLESRPKPRGERITRYYLKVFYSDLPTAVRRDKSQKLIPMTWYSRK